MRDGRWCWAVEAVLVLGWAGLCGSGESSESAECETAPGSSSSSEERTASGLPRWHCGVQAARVNQSLEQMREALGLRSLPRLADLPEEDRERVARLKESLELRVAPDPDQPYLQPLLKHLQGNRHTRSVTRNPEALLQRKIVTSSEAEGLPRDTYRTFFDLRNMSSYRVLNATLYFYVERRGPAEEAGEELKYSVHIYRYLSPDDVATEPLATETRILAPRSPGRWEAVSITEPIRNSVQDPHKNFGFMIKAFDVGAEEVDLVRRRPPGSGPTDRPNERIFVEIQVEEVGGAAAAEAESRFPPPSEVCDLEAGSYRSDCCRFPLEVNFEQLGWDWIIAPKRYNAFYCAGRCGPSDGHSQYAHLAQQALGSQGPGPCCSPQRMGDLSVIYVDDAGNVRSRNMPSMIVHKCGCF